MSSHKTILPSKKFIITLVVLVVIFLLVTLLPKIISRGKNGEWSIKEKEAPIEITVADTLENDMDGDGLEDWEEALWGTDPTNPDSDGNGISDGEEVSMIRGERSSGTKNTELSVEDVIARELFTTMSLLDANNNGELSEEQLKQLTTSLAERMNDIDVVSYTQADLNVVVGNYDSRASYAQEIYQLLNQYPFLEEDIVSVASFLQEEDLDGTSSLVSIADKYEQFADKLLLMNVPNDAVYVHLPLLNAVKGYGEIVVRIINANDEPLVALKAITDFEAGVDSLLSAYTALEEAFTI